MLSVALFFVLAFFYASFLQPQTPFFVRAIPQQHPDVSSVASRGSTRQISAFLDAHNDVRSKHNALALTWSRDLAEEAASWADRCRLEHSEHSGVLNFYGENIAAGTGNFSISDAIATFISDEVNYNHDNPSYLRFTQVVWRSTTNLGCAVSTCRGLFGPNTGYANIYVCRYYPAGNVVGQIKDNVQ